MTAYLAVNNGPNYGSWKRSFRCYRWETNEPKLASLAAVVAVIFPAILMLLWQSSTDGDHRGTSLIPAMLYGRIVSLHGKACDGLLGQDFNVRHHLCWYVLVLLLRSRPLHRYRLAPIRSFFCQSDYTTSLALVQRTTPSSRDLA